MARAHQDLLKKKKRSYISLTQHLIAKKKEKEKSTT